MVIGKLNSMPNSYWFCKDVAVAYVMASNGIYRRMNRWAPNGVLVCMSEFHTEQITKITMDVLCLDSISSNFIPMVVVAKKRTTILREILWRLDYKMTYVGYQ